MAAEFCRRVPIVLVGLHVCTDFRKRFKNRELNLWHPAQVCSAEEHYCSPLPQRPVAQCQGLLHPAINSMPIIMDALTDHALSREVPSDSHDESFTS
jgi:hypothetical protein